jgi:hypothetical protein
MRHCHCSVCRKQTGSAFSTVAVVLASEFSFRKGDELVKFYEYPPYGRRAFCSVCGSKAPQRSMVQDIPIYLICAGLFDDDPVERPMAHLFAESKAPWWNINDNLPQITAVEKGSTT